MKEDQIQIGLAAQLKGHPAYGSHNDFIFFHIPNGGVGETRGRKLKAMGVLAGAPDLIFLFRTGPVMFVELKTRKGALSPQQKTFQDICTDYFIGYHVIKARDHMDAYMQIKPILDLYLEAPVYE